MTKIHASVQAFDVFYGKKQVLFGIDLDINKQEVTTFLGSSGCGKSTLLRCFNRMNDYVPDCRVSGRIIIDGLDIYTDSVDVVLLRAKVGMVFQRPNLFPCSIYDNVAYGPRIHGLAHNRSKLDSIVEKSLRSVGLWAELQDRLREGALNLSGGQQQRLCIARAIAVKPMMLLMDEPSSALDPASAAAIEVLIQELKTKFTVILVTHSISQAKRLSDTVVIFEAGKIVEVGNSIEVFENPKSEQTKRYLSD